MQRKWAITIQTGHYQDFPETLVVVGHELKQLKEDLLLIDGVEIHLSAEHEIREMIKAVYVLTDGKQIFEQREMDFIDLQHAKNTEHRKGTDRYWLSLSLEGK